MNIGISQEIDFEIQSKCNFITLLSDNLSEYFVLREYGSGVQNIFIGFICVKPMKGYEEWFKIRKPKYKSYEKIKMLDNKSVELNGVITYDIKLEFEEFKFNSELENKKLLSNELIDSVYNLNNFSKKIANFEYDLFANDFKEFFAKEGYV